VKEDHFKNVEKHFTNLNIKEGINASPFEILTATAFSLFNKAKVDYGVIEVGMGGTLDATNILNNQAVSVITKIALDHQSYLGTTVEEIARHKAGILRPNVPYIVNPSNSLSVQDVIDDYAKEIGAGPRLVGDTPRLRETLYSLDDFKHFASALRPFQLDNAVLAIIAVKEALKSDGKDIKNDAIADELLKKRTTKPGRLEFCRVSPVFGQAGDPGRQILVDGAHNVDAAHALKEFIGRERHRPQSLLKVTKRTERRDQRKEPPEHGWRVTWVLAMTEGKDATQFLKTILRPGDSVITTTFGPVEGMPWVKPMNAEALLQIAKSVQPRLSFASAMPKTGVLRALCASKYVSDADGSVVALTGSLYLAGDLHREMRGRDHFRFWTALNFEDERIAIKKIHKEEYERIKALLDEMDNKHGRVFDAFGNVVPRESSQDEDARETPDEKEARLQAELDAVDKEMDRLALQELQQLATRHQTPTPSPDSTSPKWTMGGTSGNERKVSARPDATERPLSDSFEQLSQRKKRLQTEAADGSADVDVDAESPPEKQEHNFPPIRTRSYHTKQDRKASKKAEKQYAKARQKRPDLMDRSAARKGVSPGDGREEKE
jgi:folylpolyglutamate synthase/dihydropteroate synthase